MLGNMIETNSGTIDISNLKKIGEGLEYKVYELDKKKVIKVGNSPVESPEIMEEVNQYLKVKKLPKKYGKMALYKRLNMFKELQSVPFIPKIYESGIIDGYSWYIQQKIEGFSMLHFTNKEFNFRLKFMAVTMSFDYAEHKNKTVEFYKQCVARGWEPHEIEARNVMVDIDGNMWVVDMDGFSPCNKTKLSHKQCLNKPVIKLMQQYGKFIHQYIQDHRI